jgi:hypothetical protein
MKMIKDSGRFKRQDFRGCDGPGRGCEMMAKTPLGN